MTRWEALVRFDNEIGEAAAKLMPFGSVWVHKLGEAFFALNEDRKYLPNIVERLVKEAEYQEAANWLQTFAITKEGGATSEEALGVLLEAQVHGYRITKDTDGTFLASGRTGTTYLRSNADIVKFAKHFKR